MQCDAFSFLKQYNELQHYRCTVITRCKDIINIATDVYIFFATNTLRCIEQEVFYHHIQH